MGKADMAVQGFRRGFQCAELMHCFRAVAEQATEWSVPVYASQVGFARAYDSVRHPAGHVAQGSAATSGGSIYQRYAALGFCSCTCRLADATDRSDRRPSPWMLTQPAGLLVGAGGRGEHSPGALAMQGRRAGRRRPRVGLPRVGRRHVVVRVQRGVPGRHHRSVAAAGLGGSRLIVALRKVRLGCDLPGGPAVTG